MRLEELIRELNIEILSLQKREEDIKKGHSTLEQAKQAFVDKTKELDERAKTLDEGFEKLTAEKTYFEKRKALFSKQEEALAERQKMVEAGEEANKVRAAKLQKIIEGKE